jgi:hypothetical protein
VRTSEIHHVDDDGALLYYSGRVIFETLLA